MGVFANLDSDVQRNITRFTIERFLQELAEQLGAPDQWQVDAANSAITAYQRGEFDHALKGSLMPKMEWEVFERDHHRPHLLVVSLKAKGKNNPAVVRANFERLATNLRASGNYAFKTEGATIHAAFEDDADAARFAAVLKPKQTTRESEWASKALASMDDAAYRRITAIVKRGRRTAKRRKPKRR